MGQSRENPARRCQHLVSHGEVLAGGVIPLPAPVLCGAELDAASDRWCHAHGLIHCARCDRLVDRTVHHDDTDVGWPLCEIHCPRCIAARDVALRAALDTLRARADAPPPGRVSGYADCPIEGCTRTGADPWLTTVHSVQLHVRCSCGWVGVRHGSHVGQLRRHGAGDDCRIVATVHAQQTIDGAPESVSVPV